MLLPGASAAWRYCCGGRGGLQVDFGRTPNFPITQGGKVVSKGGRLRRHLDEMIYGTFCVVDGCSYRLIGGDQGWGYSGQDELIKAGFRIGAAGIYAS
jgi:hypothetical protein